MNSSPIKPRRAGHGEGSGRSERREPEIAEKVAEKFAEHARSRLFHVARPRRVGGGGKSMRNKSREAIEDCHYFCLHFTSHSLGQGFAMGAGSFGTYEFVKRTLPRAASSLLGPAAPADLATPILLTACALQSIVCAVCGAPFESSRAMVMAGTSAGGRDPPATLGAALGRIMSEPSADGETTSANSSPSTERDSVEFRRLWNGLPMLLSRELPFGVTKLFVYAATQARTCCCCSSDYSDS